MKGVMAIADVIGQGELDPIHQDPSHLVGQALQPALPGLQPSHGQDLVVAGLHASNLRLSF